MLEMVRNYKRKNEKRYTKDELIEAIERVRNGEIRLCKAVRDYNIPRSPLKNHLGGRNTTFKSGRRPTLSEEHEKLLLEVIFYLSDCAMGLDDFALSIIVRGFVQMRGLKTQFKNDLPGPDWISG